MIDSTLKLSCFVGQKAIVYGEANFEGSNFYDSMRAKLPEAKTISNSLVCTRTVPMPTVNLRRSNCSRDIFKNVATQNWYDESN